jgi:hypothetical protein
LLSSIYFRVPLDSVANEQLSRRHIVVWEAGIIKNASLDDNSAWEGLASAVKRSTTVRTEVRSDPLAGLCSFRNLFRLAWSLVRGYGEG